MKNLITNHNNGTKSYDSFFENRTEENLINKKQLANKLGCSVSSINKYIKNKKIFPIKIGKLVRFKYSVVVAALEKRSCL